MPTTTKLECAHCGSALKTTKAVVPGANVRCPKCKELFQVPGSLLDGMEETIPIAGEMESVDVELPSPEPQPKKMKAAIQPQPASDALPPRMGVPLPAASTKIEYGGNTQFGGSRTIVASVCVVIGVALVGGFCWWYFGTVKELDVAANVAVEQRTAKIAKVAKPLTAESPKEKSGVTPAAAPAPVVVKITRVTAPATLVINEMVVGITSAKLGPLEGGDGRDVLTLNLQITNKSKKPVKYAGWSAPEIKARLRDGFGNFYNRVSLGPTAAEIEIKPGETITDRLLFEKTTVMADLSLDLPAVGTEVQYEFRIARPFIEGAGGPAAVAAKSTAPQPAVEATGGSKAPGSLTPGSADQPGAKQASAKAVKADPETDQKLREKIRSDYREKLADINKRKLGMSTNEGNQFKRRETAKLLKRLATENEITEDQVKKIAGLK